MKKEKIIWKEFNQNYISIIILFFIILIVISVFLNGEIALGILLLMGFSILSLPFFFKKDFMVTDKGIITGNDYVMSKKVDPLVYPDFFNSFKYPFKKSFFIRWKDIKKITMKEVPYDGFIYSNLRISSNQGILVVRLIRLGEKELLENVLIKKLGKKVELV